MQLQYYKDIYQERAAILEFDASDKVFTRNQANALAAKQTLDIFIDNENPTQEEIRNFRIFISKKENNT